MVIRLLPLVGLSASITFLYLGSHIVSSLSITVEVPGKAPVKWEGCLYRRVAEVPNKDLLHCKRCINGGKTMAKFKTQAKEEYRNCSLECGRPTVCTVYHYKTGPNKEEGPLCYECDRLNVEHDLYFKFRRSSQICSDECKACARKVDLASSNTCAFACGGKSTFCYPPRSWFGHEVCHQLDHIHGCIYASSSIKEQIIQRKKFLDCLGCVKLTAVPGPWSTFENLTRHAQMCAPVCDGRPIYLRLNEDVTSLSVNICTLKSHMELLDIDIPPELKYFINPHNPQLGRNPNYSPLY